MCDIVVIETRNGVTQMTTETRIAEWIASSRSAATATFTASQAFEQAIRDMRHAGYRLPAPVVIGVRAALVAA
jgi:precorrin-4 methylase